MIAEADRLGAAALVLTTGERTLAQQQRPQGFIQGAVESSSGPEAGVWVIAETTELGTRFAKMVVTDEVGRYVIPDLPKANYDVFVRGYGLVDSARVRPAKTSEARSSA